jgi:hypothetical protein
MTRRLISIIQFAILAAFLLIPVWYRVPTSLVGSHLYVTRFLILLPMLIAIGGWLIAGLPGLRTLHLYHNYDEQRPAPAVFTSGWPLSIRVLPKYLRSACHARHSC